MPHRPSATLLLLAGMLAAQAPAPAPAAVPRTIDVRARLTDAAGQPLADGAYGVTFRLFGQVSGGAALAAETLTVNVTGGLGGARIGASGSLDALDFNQPLWVEVQVALDPPMIPRIALSSSPTALNADRLDGLDSSAFLRAGVPLGALEVTGAVDAGSLCIAGDCKTSWPDAAATGGFTAIRQTDGGAQQSYTVSLKRYVVEATPSKVGVAVALDHTIFRELCADVDGCDITIGMRNWVTSQPGNVASRGPYRLFYNDANGWWRVAQHDSAGQDGDAGIDNYSHWDCYFGDFDTSTSTNNGRSDTGRGMGLLNARGGDYSDANVTCVLVLDD